MRLLLDTHIFLWYITGDARVSQPMRRAIEDSEMAFLSVVSLWEATIKYHLGKLPLPEEPHPWLSVQREEHGIQSLPLDEGSVVRLGGLPLHHRDPFDRILVCQALEHDLEIVSVDSVLSRYPAPLWSAANPH
jgi:PIN domain nuclease of toxin-antitoxin system